MQVINTRIDLEKTRAAWPSVEFLPAHIIPRDDNKKWRILDAPYSPSATPSFASAAADKYIRIPLFPYKLSPTGDVALAFMLRMGLSFVNHISANIDALHIVTGHPVELIYRDRELTHMLCWIGFAFAEKD